MDEPVYVLSTRSETLSFRRNFFGTPDSAVWGHTIRAPCVRIGCAELELTNTFGSSPVAVAGFSELAENGIRTLHGGQVTLQVEGVLGIINDPAPPLSSDGDYAIRDVFAMVKTPPAGGDIAISVVADGAVLTPLVIPEGTFASLPVSGAELPVLQRDSELSIDILGVGVQFPGADLTVTIRV